MPPRHLRLAALLALSLGTLGCPSPDNPCDDDAFGCDDDPVGALVYDESCTLEGPLDVAIGWGLDEYNTFASGPRVYDGAQGGQHVFFGARVENAAFEDYPQLELRFRVLELMEQDWCQQEIERARVENPNDLPQALRDDDTLSAEPEEPVFVVYGDEIPGLPVLGSSRCVIVSEERIVLLEPGDPMQVEPSGAVEVDSVFVALGYGGGSLAAVVEAADPCGRTGLSAAAFDRY